MTQIIEAESLQTKIETHSHFNNSCLEQEKIDDFHVIKKHLNKCKDYFEYLKNTEKEIIQNELDKKNKQKELDNLKVITKKDLDNLKLKLNGMEKIYIQEKENKLNAIINNYNNYGLKNQYDKTSLDKEIENLKNEIILKEESLRNELDLKKKEELFKLTNEYKIKLCQYTNKKKLEKLEKEKDMEIKQKKFEADKAIEFNELNKKSLLVEKIIASIKNISLIK